MDQFPKPLKLILRNKDHVVAKQKYVHGYRLALDGNYDSLQNVTWVN